MPGLVRLVPAIHVFAAVKACMSGKHRRMGRALAKSITTLAQSRTPVEVLISNAAGDVPAISIHLSTQRLGTRLSA
jgi:hypothetical protein